MTQLILIVLIAIYLFCKLAKALLTEPQKQQWLVVPPWDGDGRAFIILAKNEIEADHIYMRAVCGWNAIMDGERSSATISLLKPDKDGITKIP